MAVSLQEPIDPVTRALVLAIGVCYHAKLQEKRQDYRKVVAQSFKAPCLLPGGEKQILRELARCLFFLTDGTFRTHLIGFHITEQAKNVFNYLCTDPSLSSKVFKCVQQLKWKLD